MLIGAADEEDLIAELAAKPGMDIRGKQRTHKVAEVLYAIHIRNGARDQKFGHRVRPSSSQGAPNPRQTKKPFRCGRKDLGIDSGTLAREDAHYPIPPDLMRSGEGIRAIAIVTKVSIQPIWQIPLISAITLIDNFRC